MWSVCSSLHVALVPRWKPGTYLSLSCCFPYNDAASIRPNFLSLNSFSKDEFPSSVSSQNQLGFDPSEELFGLDVDLPPRDQKPEASEPRSWFGPNGQYIKELPCPNCRGRGYTPCTECGIERFRQDCSLCGGKGIMTCQRCLGERVIWEESIDEKPWEKARSVSPLKVKEDDEVDNLDLNLDLRKKSKRVYRSPAPEVGLKISRSLKSLNAKTGLFSKRMKIIHRDPALHAQRVAAIKKAKSTAAARKRASETLKTFFSDPENRRQRSIAMKGVKFFCKNCGREGHRKYYCPELGESADRRFRCRLCGQRGHNKRTCQTSRTRKPKFTIQRYHCRACGQVGHNRRTCIVNMKGQSGSNLTRKKGYVGYFRKPYECRICGEAGHNSRTCPQQSQGLLDIDATELESSLKWSKRVHRSYKCRVCGTNGHNRRTCSERTAFGLSDDATAQSGSAIDPGDNLSLSAH